MTNVTTATTTITATTTTTNNNGGATTDAMMTSTRTVTFSDNQSIIPGNILESYEQTITWEDDAVFQSFVDADKATFQKSSLIVQRFIRANLIHWREFNDKKCRILEELDNLELIQKGELERVQDCKEDMKREAEMEITLEVDLDSQQREELMEHVKGEKQEIKGLDVEISTLKRESEELKKENKRIAMDTFSLYEFFTQAVSHMKGLESERRRLENVRNKFAKCVGTLKSLLESLDHDIAGQIQKRQELDSRIDTIIACIEERQSQRKLIKKLLKIKTSANSSATGADQSYIPIEPAS